MESIKGFQNSKCEDKRPSLSIVICTHRRFNLLAGAVESLVNQSASVDTYEVIIVDNDHQPNLEVKEIVSKAGSKISIRYLHESKLGLSHARNAGGKLAASDYIGYIDDDAKANPNYIKILAQILDTHKPDVCGGPHYPFYLDPKPLWFLDRYGSGSHGNESRYLMNREYLSGMNIIFRRGLLDEVGWFNPNLGMIGKKIWYGEETMVMLDAWKVYPELKVYYDPGLFVYHLVPAHKMSIWNKIKRSFQYGRSQAYFWLSETERGRSYYNAIWIIIMTCLRLLSKELLEVMFRDREKYSYWQNYVYEETTKSFRILGSLIRLFYDMIRKKTPDNIKGRCNVNFL